MYVCICNAINEAHMRDASKKYCNVGKFLASNDMKYECALCRSGLEIIFETLKKERKDENNK